MKDDLLQFLACPVCHAHLWPESPPRESQEIDRGALKCTSGSGSYPVEGGVPRLLPDGCKKTDLNPSDHHQETGQRFGNQWKMFHYGGTTWGITTEERVEVALHELAWREEDLAGKVILDAGCGNGTLSAALAERGAHVIALDLSDSVVRAHQHYPGLNVHFVQGNLFYPPLRSRRFDAIYSCGVFHHTPSARRCFDSLVRLLRNDCGSRYFVWLYAKRSTLFNAAVEPLMKLARHMPDRFLVLLCLVSAPLVEASSRLLKMVGLEADVPRTIRDRAIQLHDLLSPPFVWYHSFEEAREWAMEARFHEIVQTVYSVDEHASDELRKVLASYRRLCRPGFGILCRRTGKEEEST
ncbi:MAG: methyltransferase domain-containing protein [Acidobacteriota bacterium]